MVNKFGNVRLKKIEEARPLHLLHYNLIIITLSAFELQRGASQNYLFDLGNFPCHFHYLLGTWCSKGN